MKKLLMLGLMLVGASAYAGTELVSVPFTGVDPSNHFAQRAGDFWVYFGTNPKLGRAWVEVALNPSAPPRFHQEDVALHLEGRWLVDGLTLDAASGKVMYNGAAVESKNLKLSLEDKSFDNGFEITSGKYETVTLE